TITGTGNLTLDSASPFTFTSGGTLSNNSVTTNGAFNWTGGGMSIIATTVNVNGGLAITQTGEKRLYGAMAPASNTTWDGTGRLEITVGGSFTNASGRLFDVQGDGTIINDINGSATFSNAGTFRKSAGAGTLSIIQDQALSFNNTGLVEVQ